MSSHPRRRLPIPDDFQKKQLFCAENRCVSPTARREYGMGVWVIDFNRLQLREGLMRRNFESQARSKLRKNSSKRRQRLLASLAAASVAGSGSLAHADTATTLTGLADTNEAVPTDHGSNAEVTLSWSVPTPPDETGNDWDQYADWDSRDPAVYQINNRVTDITFTPTGPGIKVTVSEFFLDEWAGGTDTSAMWSVTGSSSGLIASGLWTDKNNANDPNDLGGRTLISPNATGAFGETLTLTFDHSASGGYISYLAMDNLTFLTMVVPEPTTAVLAWMGVGGLGAMAMRRKRK
jgi:hypothetical protein